MADVKISQLPAATTPLTGAELVPVVQSGVNKQTTTSDVLAVPATLLTASSAVATDASKKFVSVTNTGTGNNVLATSPTLVTPALGTPSSGVVTNLTGTASININGTVGATTPTTGTFTTITLNEKLLTSGNYVILGKSTNNALRVFPQADATGVEIATTDSTGVVAFKPLVINGLTITIKNSAGGGQIVVSGSTVTVTGLTVAGGAQFITTNTALNNAAAAAAGTLLNAPVAGNPTKWIGINDNGTIRYIPAW